MLTITKTEEADKIIIAPEGRLDTNTAPQMEEALKEVIDTPLLILDFSMLNYVSSSGLRVLLSLQKKMTAQGGALTLTNVPTEVMEIFELTGFIDILDIQ